jgi:glutathione S-transferase
MVQIELYSATSCPYAQRTRLLLSEKGIEHILHEVDLDAKPAWFDRISPYSKVPVLKQGNVVIWESSIINEYIEELFPDPPLMPLDPARRAHARFWIDFCNVRFTPTWYKLLLAQDAQERASLTARLRDHFLFMEHQGIAALGGGPHLMGSEMSLVDITFYPWFERLPVMAHYRNFRIPDECRLLRRWARRMSQRQSVRESAHPAEFYILRNARYADGTAVGTTAIDMRQ